MPSRRNRELDLQKLAHAVARIRSATPARSKGYNVMVENPFESGYWPPAKPPKRDLAAANRLRLAHAATAEANKYLDRELTARWTDHWTHACLTHVARRVADSDAVTNRDRIILKQIPS